jgi:Rhodopirellula transposase DDE domain
VALKNLKKNLAPGNFVRRPGAGRRRKELTEPGLQAAFDGVIDGHTAGCPVVGVRWTYLNKNEIVGNLMEKGIQAGRGIVARLLGNADLGQRKISKALTMKEEIAGRNEQFEQIAAYKKEYLGNDWPVLSIDTKKKEQLGRFYREGQVLSDKAVKSNDHDFPSFSPGKVVPYGVYDVGRNEGHLLLGQSDDTAEFNVACLRQYWEVHGAALYHNNEPILVLADGGGSNASANRLFKQELQVFADDIGRPIRVAHYPPYCSKYNPIEHRLFPFITKAWNGVMLDGIDTMVRLVEERTKNLKSKIKISVCKIEKAFKKGVTVYDDYLEHMDIVFDEINKKWNYWITPLGYITTVNI